LIFATVGTQLPFDRLIVSLDRWVGAQTDPPQVFAQIGPTSFRPTHLDWAPFVEPDHCGRLLDECHGVIAHAGMGTIIGAVQRGKPLVILPRRSALGEHRNEHQLATARHFSKRAGIRVILDEQDLEGALDDLVTGRLSPGERISGVASADLIATVRSFIREVHDVAHDFRPSFDEK
jgi:UDP-N-acetylglucosamine transferase subunit ALG13